MGYYFIAYASQDPLLSDLIGNAVRQTIGGAHEYRDWAELDRSGTVIQKAIEGWILDSGGVVADISIINPNVTYEIGYAIGLGKAIRLIRSSAKDFSSVKAVGLFNDILHDQYVSQTNLATILGAIPQPLHGWHKSKIDKDQPVYIVAPNEQTRAYSIAVSAVKKTVREKFRSFKPWEVGRISAHEIWEKVSASLGVVTFWTVGDGPEVQISNQRAMLAFGMARGINIPAVMLADEDAIVPNDITSTVSRFKSFEQIEMVFRGFRDDVQDARSDHVEQPTHPVSMLDRINIGDPAAENEQDRLSDYFLDTEEFKQTLSGQNNIVVGRKGCGKTAIFLQVRDRVRVDKRNIVVDLNPEGAQLIKLKERMVEVESLGARKEFISAFWQYVVWLEIAYKIIEKDERASRHDWQLSQRYEKLKDAFQSRVDTGVGDFSERLRLLVDLITARFETKSTEQTAFKSSSVLEIVYGQNVADIRDQVISYLNTKGKVLFLFDNIDRMRAPGGFDESDAIIIVGLVESMQEMSRSFRKWKIDFQWAVFLRSDVYEFLCRRMADYGKLSERKVEWTDRAILVRLIQRRVTAATTGGMLREWDSIWSEVSDANVAGKSAMEFMIDASMMRPRYLIRMFESAKRRAVNLDRQRIASEDYLEARRELAWTALSDLGQELADVVKDSDGLIFDILELDGACGLAELRAAINAKVSSDSSVDRVIEVLLWSGCIGFDAGKGAVFIHDCGHNLDFLRALMRREPNLEVKVHPTLQAVAA